MNQETITIQASINAPVEKVWHAWTAPEHITKWAFASDDWEAPYAENDVTTGGKFLTRMSAKDGSASFDFNGTYTNVIHNELIEYTIADGRKVTITFEKISDIETKVTETFAMEDTNSQEQQRAGWQAILDNFKSYTEGL